MKLNIRYFGKIEEASIEFGDLTIFVGPQATGKTLVLELTKLIKDKGNIVATLRKYGYEFDQREFISLFFGGGMGNLFRKETRISLDGKCFDLEPLRGSRVREKVFYIPAQRVLTLSDGWPRPFDGFNLEDPYVVKNFSENMRILLERRFEGAGTIFPPRQGLKKSLRELLDASLFWGAELKKTTHKAKKRISLRINSSELPYMVWSAGQREFVPLLLGFYWLLPPRVHRKRKGTEIVIIEEPEMGLHPRALEIVILLILELLHRGYKVAISTHSAIFLDFAMLISYLKEQNISKRKALDTIKAIFDIHHEDLDPLFRKALTSDIRVHYFKPVSRNKVRVIDISNLMNLEEEEIADWGGLLSFGTKINNILAELP